MDDIALVIPQTASLSLLYKSALSDSSALESTQTLSV
jgi:hypothetical protein